MAASGVEGQGRTTDLPCTDIVRQLTDSEQRLTSCLDRQTVALSEVRAALDSLLPALLHIADLRDRREDRREDRDTRQMEARVKLWLAAIAALSAGAGGLISWLLR